MKIIKTNVLALSNWILVLKILFIQIIILSAFVAFVVFVLNISMSELVSVFDNELFVSGKNLALQFIAKNYSADAFMSAIAQFGQDILKAFETNRIEFNDFFNKVSMTYLIILSCIFLLRFLNGLLDLPLVMNINDFMTSGSRKSFLWRVFKCIGRSALLQLLYMTMTGLLDWIIILASVGFYILVFFPYGYIGLAITIMIALLMFSLRMTVFSFWLPGMAADEAKIIKGLKNGLKIIVDRFWQVFTYTLAVLMICLTLIFVEVIFMDGAYWAIGAATITLLIGLYKLKCMNLVQFYEANNRPYFSKKLDMVITHE